MHDSPLEAVIVKRILLFLRARGWLVEKVHGGRYMAGWPDLFAFHPKYGYRWIEVKRPGTGRLTDRQRARFTKWNEHGCPIWILTSRDECTLLKGPPNVASWLA